MSNIHSKCSPVDPNWHSCLPCFCPPLPPFKWKFYEICGNKKRDTRRAYFQETWRPYLQSPPMLTTLQASTASSPGLTAELVGSSAHLWLLHTKLGITNVTKIPRNAISLPGTLVLSTKYCHCFFTSVPTNVIRSRTLRNTGTCVRRAAVVGQLERGGHKGMIGSS